MSIRLDHGEDSLEVVHDINVTPFIDVILVLLIIFMIAAPLATVDVQVDLPTSNVTRQPRPDQPIFLTIKSDLSLALGYAGWGEGQLDDELRENVWLTAEADDDILFDQDHETKWARAIARIGVDVAHLSGQAGTA